jgi:transglutaminase-like putative cysteine protease
MSGATATPPGPATVSRFFARGNEAPTGGDIRMSALLLLALAVAITGLHNVLEDIGWWFPAFGVMFVVFAVAAVVRFYSRRSWAGTAAGVVAAIIILTLFFAADASFLGFVPTGDTVARFVNLTNTGNDSIARQTLPAFATSGIQFLICLAVAGIAIFMDAVANWLRLPALVGIPLLIVVVIPSIIIASLADGLTFELTAIVYLLIVLFRGRRVQPAVAISAGVIAVLGALVTPIVLPSVAVGGTTGSGLGVLAQSINPIINLGNDLRDSDAAPALSYTTTSSTGEYLQLTTLDSFVGDQWAPATPILKGSHSVKAIGAPPGLTSAVGSSRVSTTVQVAGASSPWLPVPYPAASVAGLKGTWLWQNGSLAIRSDNASTQGQRYSVASLDIEPTIQQLEAAGSGTSSSNALAKVPAGLNPIVAATAKKVVGNAKTDFDKAVALQKWFTGGTFTYSTKAPKAAGYDGSGLNVIVPFLKDKSGYCVHFATTMAVMARTLGIPSRVAVGFLPGKLTHVGSAGTDVYQVSSSDMHAWPELYFKNIGWVRFEPTPSKGFEPNFPSAPGTGTTIGPTAPSSTAPTDTATTAPIKAPKLPNQGANSTRSALSDNTVSPTASFGSLGALAILLLVAAPAFIRIGIRRRRLDQIRQGVDPAGWSWQELRESARDLGIHAPTSLTPAELTAALTEYLERAPKRTAAAVRALAQLQALVEDESYGVPAYRYNGEQMAEELVTVLRGLRSATRAANRISATIVPPTLVDRVLGRSAATA